MQKIINFIKKLFQDERILQFIKFGIVGVTSSVLSYVLYSVTLLLLTAAGSQWKYNYIIAQVVEFVLSVLWSFYWNNRMVFTTGEGEHRNMWKALLKTYVTYSFTGLFLNTALLVVWIEMLHISEFIAPIINIIIGVPINFVLNKFWAFRTEKVDSSNK